MKKPCLPGAFRLLVLIALTTPIFAGTVTEKTLTISRPTTDISIPSTASVEASKAIAAVIPGRTDNFGDMPGGARSYTSNGDTKTYAFGTTSDFINATNLMNDNAVSLSSVNYGRIPFQQLLIVSTAGNNSSSSSAPVAQLPEPASLILIGTGLAALGMGMRKKKIKKS
jgi:PEP-CTERM motif